MTMDWTNLILANAAAGDDFMVSGKWLIALAVAVIPALGAVWVKAKQTGAREAQESSVTLKKPVPTIQTREEPRWATTTDLDDHVGWARDEFKRVWGQFGTERKLDEDRLKGIEDRINVQSLATASLKGSVEEIGKNVSQLLHLSLHGKTPPNRRS